MSVNVFDEKISKILIKPLTSIIKKYTFRSCDECNKYCDPKQFRFKDPDTKRKIKKSTTCCDCVKLEYKRMQDEWTPEKKEWVRRMIFLDVNWKEDCRKLRDIAFSNDDPEDIITEDIERSWWIWVIAECDITYGQMKELVIEMRREYYNLIFQRDDDYDEDIFSNDDH
jgi:hypothetical protein